MCLETCKVKGGREAMFSKYTKLTFEALLAVILVLTSCSQLRTTSGEILIALKPEAVSLLNQPQEPDPMHTGIPSLDLLNRKWQVHRMVKVFSEVSPGDELATRYGLAGIYKLVVPRGTNLAAMVRDYRGDPNIEYAEINQRYEIK